MTARFKGFENLEVWRAGCKLSVDTYSAFRGPKDYGFKDQICRAAVSIPSNIAEGSERNGPKEFARFLNIAKGSCGELRTQVHIAQRIGYLNPETGGQLLANAESIAAMLAALIMKISRKT